MTETCHRGPPTFGPSCMITLALMASPALAHAQFVEPEARVIRLLSGDQNGDYFGWVASTIGDLNDDGVEELLIPAIGYESFSGRATVFSGRRRGRSSTTFLIAGTKLPCPADLNGNGRVGLGDLRRMLRALRRGDDADLNGDTVTDLRDLEVLVKDWGRCPGRRKKGGRRHHSK